MKIYLAALAVMLSFISTISPSTDTDHITVYLFMREDCVICQYYTLPLKNLYETYQNEHLRFEGVFPNFSSKKDKIKAFKTKYDIPFELTTDYFKQLTNQFGVRVTPEVVVYNETTEKILYQGRIDNTYFRVGKRRRVTTTSELEQVLEAIKTQAPIPKFDTPAVGCLINKDF